MAFYWAKVVGFHLITNEELYSSARPGKTMPQTGYIKLYNVILTVLEA